MSTPTPRALAALAEELKSVSVEIRGDVSTEVSSITEDSRAVRKGSLFVARPGEKVDGARYVKEAVDKGASAILCARGTEEFDAPCLLVDDVPRAFGLAAHALYAHPSRALSVVGVTGTNGKTTVTSLVCQALFSLGVLSAKSGTLGFFIGSEFISDSLTTPPPDQLAGSLALAVSRGATVAALEVSSHALSQKRVFGIEFEVVAFTNLTQDHLDYHGTMEEYGQAKAGLFLDYSPRASVINVDDVFGKEIFQRVQGAITVGTGPGSDVSARDARFERSGLTAVVTDRGEECSLSSSLLGRHNLENLLVSWGILRALGHAPDAIAEALSAARGVPGRMERCDAGKDDIVVVVDYAHTPDALRRALLSLEELSYPSVTCVFGCGGDRDASKRVFMGEVAAQLADRIYLTSDNPRSEDPEAILSQILPGLALARTSPHVISDRRLAIERAIVEAPSGSVVLIAGKGHEDYQLVGDQVLAFDDRVEARRALLLRRAKEES